MDRRTEEGEIATVGGKKSKRRVGRSTGTVGGKKSERRVGRNKKDDTGKPFRFGEGKLPDRLQRILDKSKEESDKRIRETMRKVHESKKRQKKMSSMCGFPIPTDSFRTVGGKKSKRRVGRNKEDDPGKPFRFGEGKLPDRLQRILDKSKEESDKRIRETMRKVHESKKRQKRMSSMCGFPIPTTDFFRSYRFN